MNESGDIPLTHSSTPDTGPCSIISVIPNIGSMSSCRGRAEAFARSLSSKLRMLGSQSNEEDASPEDEPIINGGVNQNTWVTTTHENEQTVRDLQPLRHESDSYFDFDCELESPGSPVDECEYLRLIETTSNTPHNSTGESRYACASVASSQSSSDGPYFDATSANGVEQFKVTTQQPKRTKLTAAELPEYVNALKINDSPEHLSNGVMRITTTTTTTATDDLEQQMTIAEEAANFTTNAIQSELTKALPITGPDELDSATVPVMTVAVAVNVQTQILSELQEQNEKYTLAVQEQEDCKDNGYNVPLPTPELKIDPQPSIEFPIDEQQEQEQQQEEQHQQQLVEEQQLGDVNSNGYTTECEEVFKIIITEIETKNNTMTLGEMLIKNEPELDTTKMEATAQTDLSALLNVDVVAAQQQQEKQQQEKQQHEEQQHEEQQQGEQQEELQQQEAPLEQVNEVEANKSNEFTSNNNDNNNARHSIDTTDDDEDDCRPQRVRRCSSLKTGKTPPGTPGRKKIVRFADVLGLDLADVKTFLDEIPIIPKSAFEDLEILDIEQPIQLGPKSDKILMPLFQQPGGLPTFLDGVREKQVSLENAAVSDVINQTVNGTVRVRNLDFHKSVHIRYTLDDWRSFADLQANYVENSCDGFSDKFTFVLFGNSLHVGQRLEFAVRFQCKGQQFWDNNYGTNYCFQCLPNSNRTTATSSTTTAVVQNIILSTRHNNNNNSHNSNDDMVSMLSPTADEAWCSSFY